MAIRGSKVYSFGAEGGSIELSWQFITTVTTPNLFFDAMLQDFPSDMDKANPMYIRSSVYITSESAGINGALYQDGSQFRKGTSVSITFPGEQVLFNMPLKIIATIEYWTKAGEKKEVPLAMYDTLNLTVNPTSTVILCDGEYIDETISIGVYPIDSTYTNTITYQFGTASGTIATKTNQTQFEWTPAANLIDGIPGAAKDGYFLVKVATYNGNTLVGNYQLSTRLYVNPETQGPYFNPVFTDTNTATTALTGNSSIIVAEKSIVRVTTGAKGHGLATISNCVVSTDDDYISGQIVTLSKPAPIVKIEATDIRGFTAEGLYTPVQYVNYYEPKGITNISLSAAGVLTAKLTGRFFNGSFGKVSNTISASYRYQKSGDSSWSAWSNISLTVNKESIEGTVTVSGLDYRQKYQIEIRLIDKLTTVLLEASSMGTTVFDWSKTDFNFNVPVNFAAGATGLSAAVFDCTTDSGVAAKVLTGNDGAIIQANSTIYVKFTHTNTVENITFRIGVKTYPVVSLSGVIAGAWGNNSLVEFVYINNTFVMVFSGSSGGGGGGTQPGYAEESISPYDLRLYSGQSFAYDFSKYTRIQIYANLNERYTIVDFPIDDGISYPVERKGGIYIPTPDLVTNSSSSSIVGYSLLFTISAAQDRISVTKALTMKLTSSINVSANTAYRIYKIVGIKL